jgi:hypothetical protein
LGYPSNTNYAKLFVYLCVTILLVFTTVQAAHLCGFQTSEIHMAIQGDDTLLPGGSLCPICLAAVTALMIVLVLLSPVLRRDYTVLPRLVRFPSFRASFRLQVRPPPAR